MEEYFKYLGRKVKNRAFGSWRCDNCGATFSS